MTRDPEYDITQRDTAGLLAGARMAGRTAEAARQTMLEAAAERQRCLLILHNMGMSIRDLARELDVSPTVVAAAIKKGRKP
jgi:DNA-directed RNA polymerase specialized sigma24 family protein